MDIEYRGREWRWNRQIVSMFVERTEFDLTDCESTRGERRAGQDPRERRPNPHSPKHRRDLGTEPIDTIDHRIGADTGMIGAKDDMSVVARGRTVSL